jgi:MFS family permease
VPLSSVFGGPLSGLLIDHGAGVLGFDSGWRFMFFVEGLPALVLGIVVLFVLPNRPRDARWLSAQEREALEKAIEAEDEEQVPHGLGVRGALKDGRVIALAVVYFGIVFGLYVLAFFLPQVVKGLQDSLSTTQIGLVTAIPYAVAAVVMVLVARHSDRTGERTFHVAVPALIGAVGVAVALYLDAPYLVIAAVTVCACGVFAAIPVIWQIPNAFLAGAGAAAGIAMINSFGNLSGFVGPYLTGWLSDVTGSFRPGMWVVAGFMTLSAVIVIGLARSGRAKADGLPEVSRQIR